MVAEPTAVARQLGVSFVPHSKGVTRYLGWCAERLGWRDWRKHYWLTFTPRIYHPVDQPPALNQDVVEHELVHIDQQRKMGRWLWLLRFVVSWRFRWTQEREAYAVCIANHRLSVDQVVEVLRRDYGVKHPPWEMRQWFDDLFGIVR